MQSNVVGIVPIHNITDFLHLQQNRFSTPPPEHTHADKLLLFNSQAKKSKTGVLLLVCSFGGGWWRDARVSTGAYVANHNPAVSDERVCPPYRVSPPIPYTHT